MILTNNGNLPKPYCDFIEKTCNKPHNEEGTYSATTLIHGVKCTELTRRHFNEIIADVSDFHNSALGTAFHYIMESNTDENKYFKEERLSYPVSHSKVTGQFDLYDMNEGIIYDWKTTNTWKHKMQDFSEWELQALVYAWLFSKNNLECKKVVFVAEFKDFSPAQSEVNPELPRLPIQREFEVVITKEKLDFIEKWIEERVKLLELAKIQKDDEITRCSDKEVWAKGEGWAVMKKGRKSALRVFDNEENAKIYLRDTGGDTIEYRKPKYTKCERYCNACQFCNFYKKEVLNA